MHQGTESGFADELEKKQSELLGDARDISQMVLTEADTMSVVEEIHDKSRSTLEGPTAK